MTCHGVPNLCGVLLKSLSWHGFSCIGKGQIIHGLRRYEVDMTVRNFKTGDDEADTLTLESVLNATGNFMSSRKKVVREMRGEISPFVNFLDGAQQNVAISDGVDCQEASTEIIAVHECSRNVASKDACENRWHLQNSRPRDSGCVCTLYV